MAGKSDLVNSIADLSVDVVSFEVLPFGLDPYGGAALDAAVASTDASAGIDPNGGHRP
ncbi:MAG TPA: hypothetical protein VFJ16_05280 [Longimicrobium sp.]|nr:hypothetical protein [Longimicrobium sp.]